jgi:hypothetical protein
LVLGVARVDGSYAGAPRGDTRIAPGDVVILYGRSPQLEALGRRRVGHDGAAAHAEAVVQTRRSAE